MKRMLLIIGLFLLFLVSGCGYSYRRSPGGYYQNPMQGYNDLYRNPCNLGHQYGHYRPY